MQATSLLLERQEAIILKLLFIIMFLPLLALSATDWDHTVTAEMDPSKNDFEIVFTNIGALGSIKNPATEVTILVRRVESFLYVAGRTDPGIDYMGFTAIEGGEFGFKGESITDSDPLYTVTLGCDLSEFAAGFDIRYRFRLGGDRSSWFSLNGTLLPASGVKPFVVAWDQPGATCSGNCVHNFTSASGDGKLKVEVLDTGTNEWFPLTDFGSSGEWSPTYVPVHFNFVEIGQSCSAVWPVSMDSSFRWYYDPTDASGITGPYYDGVVNAISCDAP